MFNDSTSNVAVATRHRDREIVLDAGALRRAAASIGAAAIDTEARDRPGDLHRLAHWLDLVAEQGGACYLRTYP